jgi:hypothetical protein
MRLKRNPATGDFEMAMRLQFACIAAAATLVLGACTDRSADSVDANTAAAAAKTKEVAVAAGHTAAELADKARDNTKAYFESPEVQKSLETAKEAVEGAVDGARQVPDDHGKK